MKAGAHVVIAAAARLYAPIILLFALTLFSARAPGEGVGFLAGLAFALAFALHALVFGADAARAALPPRLLRVILALGAGVALAAAGAPALSFAPQAIEAGTFAAVAAACALIVIVLFGRAPTLRDADQ